MIDFQELEKAIKAIKELGVKRIDGNGFIVYKVQNIIRIDIKE
jgi:hypothetical protein